MPDHAPVPNDARPLNILWLKSGPLHPPNTGGRKRTYHMVKELRKLHHVTYLALDAGDGQGFSPAETAEYCQELVRVPFRETPKGTPAFYLELLRNALASNLPYVLERYRSPELTRRLTGLTARPCDLLVCDFLTPALNLPRPSPVPTLLFQHNVEAAIWRRMVENAGHPFAKIYLGAQHRRMVRHETELSRQFDGVVAVSEDDATQFRQVYGLSNVLGAVPTGVDLDFFNPANPANGSAQAQAANARTVAFLGSMDWLPNIDAVQYYAAGAWDQVLAACPDAKFLVIGRNPPAKLHDLAARAAGNSIRLTGTVDDVRPHLAGCAAMVVPLTIGGGTRIKIYEAMALGVPVISTTIGAEGLPVRHGEHLLIADDPAALAAATRQLLENPAQGRELAASALRLVRENFGWEAITREFETLCRQAIAAGQKRLATSG